MFSIILKKHILLLQAGALYIGILYVLTQEKAHVNN